MIIPRARKPHQRSCSIPQPDVYRSLTTTISTGLLIFIVAFFPNQFAFLIRYPFGISTSPSSSHIPHHHTCCSACTTNTPTPTMSWHQTQFNLPTRSRGSYLITSDVEKQSQRSRTIKSDC